MKPNFLIAFLIFFFIINFSHAQTVIKEDNEELAALIDQYYKEYLKLFPLNATFNGDNRYNDRLFADFTDGYRATLKEFYLHYLYALKDIKRDSLNDNDKLSYDIFKYNAEIKLEGLSIKDNRMPASQFYGLPLTIGQLGSGEVVQPFKTVKDYQNWVSRATAFSAWVDSAIVYYKKGIAENIVLPKALVVKMIPQLETFVEADSSKNVFYGPVRKMPQDFSDSDKKLLTNVYVKLINERLIPSYKKLADFLKNEYLPKARTTSGWGALPGGDKMYNYRIRLMTTVNKSAEEMYTTGLSEVKRIRSEMEKAKELAGFKGDLKAFFEYMNTDPKFFPYKTPEEVLNAYRAIQQKIDPNLKKMFGNTPKTSFEIRQTEAFRAATAAAEYFPGSLENNRPGIFYVPIADVTKTPVGENLFLHEAIPGHHYQISLQKENENLSRFRRFYRNSAYTEGWGLYAESLGRELGLYTDPYQYMYALSDEMHRAIRLVADAGLHAKGWTREQAIKYMMDNEPISEQKATAEIERYMAIPGQALAYKTGELKIKEMRNKYSKQLGSAFSLSAFHDELLKDGAMPLGLLEKKMDAWAMKQKK
jgi:uncharacterized protein (DUF885 family)